MQHMRPATDKHSECCLQGGAGIEQNDHRTQQELADLQRGVNSMRTNTKRRGWGRGGQGYVKERDTVTQAWHGGSERAREELD